MKGFPTIVAFLLLLGPRPALAQDPLVRGDVSATLGWFSANKSELESYNDWYNRSLIGEAAGSVYWTNHWKTEVAAGASTEAWVYGSQTFELNGARLFAPSRVRFGTRRLSFTQQYQFGDNEWVHPYLGVGIDLVWERSLRRDEPFYAYDPVTRQSRLVRGAVEDRKETDLRAVPSVSGGFKAYMTRRAFFRGDLRINLRHRPEEVVLRFGFGVDF